MFKIIGGDGQQYGPVSAEQLRQWIATGRANGQSLVQAEGSSDWKALSTHAEFASDLKPAPPPLGAQPITGQMLPNQATAKASNKLAAGLCGILLGGLGVHKF